MVFQRTHPAADQPLQHGYGCVCDCATSRGKGDASTRTYHVEGDYIAERDIALLVALNQVLVD